LFVVLVGERNRATVQSLQSLIGDGDAVGISTEVIEYTLGATEGRLGVDHPFLAAQSPDEKPEACRLFQPAQFTEEPELTASVCSYQILQEQSSESAREHAYREEELRSAADPSSPVGREPTAGYDAVDMGMMAPTPTIP
jgi:hypothetical protein